MSIFLLDCSFVKPEKHRMKTILTSKKYIMHRLTRAYELLERLQPAFQAEQCTREDIEMELTMLWTLIEGLQRRQEGESPSAEHQ